MFGIPTFSGGFSGSFILRDEGRCVQRAAAAWGRCYGQLGSRHSRLCWVIVFTAPQVDAFQVAATIGRWATFSGTDKKHKLLCPFLQSVFPSVYYFVSLAGPGPLLDLHAWSVCLVSVTAMVRFAPSCDAFWNAIFATSNPDTMMILMLQCWCLLSWLQVLMKTIVQVFKTPLPMCVEGANGSISDGTVHCSSTTIINGIQAAWCCKISEP
jgi:hypothetical protein